MDSNDDSLKAGSMTPEQRTEALAQLKRMRAEADRLEAREAAGPAMKSWPLIHGNPDEKAYSYRMPDGTERVCRTPEDIDAAKAQARWTSMSKIVSNWFTYHPPFGTQVDRYARVREFGMQLATAIVGYCPDTPDRAEALRKVREAVMWANASIACGEEQYRG